MRENIKEIVGLAWFLADFAAIKTKFIINYGQHLRYYNNSILILASNVYIWQESCSSSARLAQSVEHETLNLRVVGSSPTLGDILLSASKKTQRKRDIILVYIILVKLSMNVL